MLACTANDKLCGDLDQDLVEQKAGYYTPVPGGVGPMTIAMLMQNTLENKEGWRTLMSEIPKSIPIKKHDQFYERFSNWEIVGKSVSNRPIYKKVYQSQPQKLLWFYLPFTVMRQKEHPA